MTPEDPRHGEYAGAVAHWFDKEPLCAACELAERRYRRRRQRRQINGEQIRVPSAGTIRRVRALMALGWRGPEIAAEANVSINTLRSIDYHNSTVVLAETARLVALAYDRLSMTVPEGLYANRTRVMAARRGWAPPLAWDDIDDPNATPWRHEEPAVTGRPTIQPLVEDFDWLIEQGESEQTAAERLGIKNLSHFKDSRRRLERSAS